jgi:hypothetical protein
VVDHEEDAGAGLSLDRGGGPQQEEQTHWVDSTGESGRPQVPLESLTGAESACQTWIYGPVRLGLDYGGPEFEAGKDSGSMGFGGTGASAIRRPSDSLTRGGTGCHVGTATRFPAICGDFGGL